MAVMASGRRTKSSALGKRGKGRHRAERRRIEPYGWLGAGAVTLGVGAALASGAGIAQAQGPASSDDSSSAAGPAAEHRSPSVRRQANTTGSPDHTTRLTAHAKPAAGAVGSLGAAPRSVVTGTALAKTLPAQAHKLVTESSASTTATHRTRLPGAYAQKVTAAEDDPFAGLIDTLNALFNNQTPTLDPHQTGEDNLGVVSGDLGAADPDSATLTYDVTQDPERGTVLVHPDGTYTYTPQAAYVHTGTTDSFEVTVSDAASGFAIHGLQGLLNLLSFGLLGSRGDSSTKTVDVVVTPIGLQAGDPAFTITTINTTTGAVLGTVNATDEEGSALSYAVTADIDPVLGTVSVNSSSGAFNFTPTPLARYQAAVTAADDTIAFTVTVSNGTDDVQIVVRAPVSALHPDDDGVLDLADLDTLASLGAVGVAEDADGIITAIVGAFTNDHVTNAADALAELNRLAGVLGAGGSFTGDIDSQTTAFGAGATEETYYRLTQLLNGVPVLGSQVILTALADGTATGVFSGINSAIYGVNTTANQSIDESAEVIAAATQILLGSMEEPPTGDQLTAFVDGLTFDQKLVVYALDPEVAPTLAWWVNVKTTADSADPVDASLPLVNATYYLYANGGNAGNVLAEEGGVASALTPTTITVPGLPHGDNPKNYTISVKQDGSQGRMEDASHHITVYYGQIRNVRNARGEIKQIGYTLSENVVTRGPSAWDPSAVSAMGNMETVYDFYKNVLGWDFNDRVPNDNGVQVGIVDSISGGAVWNPGLLNFTFGTNSEAALDVVGHEFTHAVIESLVPGSWQFTGKQGEALDEAYGDIIGNLIEHKDDAGEWLFGEDADGDPYRDMKDPSRSGLSDPGPANFSDFDWGVDQGHANANIFDHAAYLMMTDNRTAGITDEKWAQIFYSSMYRLPTEATFQNARNAVIASASVQGLTPDQQRAIAEAFDEVGIGATPRVKIVLTWGSSPSDLDSHLTGPPSVVGGSPFHVFYSQRDYFQNGSYSSANTRLSVDLDYDDTSSYGPESTTIRNLVPGDYYFYVHDYSNRNSTSSTAMGDSGATVTVYKPSQSDDQNLFGFLFGSIFGSAPTVFHVDTSSDGTLWTVFKLTITAGDVNNPTITAIDQYSYQSNPRSVGL
ncbi:hypothetical protein BH09ACT8_BH09ACT8_56740 [soil metagenome]